MPTLHVVGCSDPYILGAVALHNMCDQETAEIFDHGKGHTVPRDAQTILELGDAIDRLVVRRENWAQPAEFDGNKTSDAALHEIVRAVEF